MSVLLMVRHGQASWRDDDYDQLSPRGREQARLLGVLWAERNLIFHHVYVGPRRRHRQTLDEVARVYRERGLDWPQPVELPGLDEHPGQLLLKHALPALMKQEPALADLPSALEQDAALAQRQYLKLFQKVTRDWVRGERRVPELELWRDFRSRVETSLQQMVTLDGRKKLIAAFTSGGPVAAAVGFALGLDDEKTLELSWLVRNTACTEFLFSTGRLSLASFNGHPHLATQELLTYI
jgi:broad specificity phosphatase PhoE